MALKLVQHSDARTHFVCALCRFFGVPAIRYSEYRNGPTYVESFFHGMNYNIELHCSVINKKSAVTTPDNWEPALPVVGMTGFEPATSWSQTKRATNCATSRILSEIRKPMPADYHNIIPKHSAAVKCYFYNFKKIWMQYCFTTSNCDFKISI